MQLLNFLTGHVVELLGVVSALVYLYFSILQKIWLWPWGIVTSALFVWIFFDSKFYADMGLNIYYVLISLYGWYHWMNGKAKTKRELPVSRLMRVQGIRLLVFSLLLSVLSAFVLIRFTDSPVPYGDAFTTAFSITATWMLARKILEHWLVWVVVDLVSAGLYLYKELWLTAGLFVLYALLAITGYREWQKKIQASA
jgi:nicotinamide mononucleotide transporter